MRFRGSGLHSDTDPIHQSRRGQSHISAQPRTKRCHNDVGQRPGSVGKNIDPAFLHHRQVILAWATGVWEGTPDLDTMQAALCGALARLSHLKRPWCGATDATVCEAPHDPRRHQDRPPGSGAQDGGLLGGPGILVVGQFCTLEPVQARFSGKPSGHSLFLESWKDGHSGIGACWSSWYREASGPRKGLRGSRARTTAAASCATRTTAATSARPCRQRERGALRRTFCGFAIQGAVRTWHFS